MHLNEDVNVLNFVYYGKTRMVSVFKAEDTISSVRKRLPEVFLNVLKTFKKESDLMRCCNQYFPENFLIHRIESGFTLYVELFKTEMDKFDKKKKSLKHSNNCQF